MTITKPLLVASALALAAGSAWAGGDKTADNKEKGSSVGSTVGNVTRSDDSGFAKMDKDKDGYISKTEAANSPIAKDFAKFDLNNDGKLNRAEYLASAARTDASRTADKAEDKVTNANRREGAATGSTTRSK
jgi:hypothetical protein